MIESLWWTLILPVSQLWQESPPGSSQKVQIQSLPFSNLFSDRGIETAWPSITVVSGWLWVKGKLWKIEGRRKNEARWSPGYSPEGEYAGLYPLDAPLQAINSTSSHHPLHRKVLFWLRDPALLLRFSLTCSYISVIRCVCK